MLRAQGRRESSGLVGAERRNRRADMDLSRLEGDEPFGGELGQPDRAGHRGLLAGRRHQPEQLGDRRWTDHRRPESTHVGGIRRYSRRAVIPDARREVRASPDARSGCSARVRRGVSRDGRTSIALSSGHCNLHGAVISTNVDHRQVVSIRARKIILHLPPGVRPRTA